MFAGCVGIGDVPADAFDRVDRVVTELDFESYGTVEIDGHSGGAIGVGDPPSYYAVVSGDDVAANLTQALDESGYELMDSSFDGSVWMRGQGEDYRRVAIQTVVAGQVISLPTGDWTLEEAGAFIVVQGVR